MKLLPSGGSSLDFGSCFIGLAERFLMRELSAKGQASARSSVHVAARRLAAFSHPVPPARRRMAIWALAALSATLCGGCMSLGGWVNDYAVAEQRQKDTGMPILVFYKNHLDPVSGRMHKMLREGAIDAATSKKQMVRCVLVTDYDPDRAFVAQYGVDRAPALTIIHPDGTYHSHVGPMQESDALAFIENAKPPGQTPTVNPYIPRPIDTHWLNNLEAATQEAAKTGKPVLIVFKWWVGRDDWRISEYFDAPEVNRLVAGWVFCRMDRDFAPTRRHMASFGLRQTPAVVILHPDGTYHSLEGLVSLDDFVRFLQSAKPPGKPRSTG